MFPDNLRCLQIIYNRSPIFCALHYSIITFDMSTELFGEIQLPEFLAQKHFLRVSVVGESLALIHSSDLNGLKTGSRYMVMVMKEYKNPASWTLLYCTQYTEVAMGKPVRLRNNGDMIVELEKRDTVMFNHNEGYYVYVYRGGEEEKDFGYKTHVDRYEESLALLDVGDSVPNKEAMEALMMIENQESGHRLDTVARHE